MSGTASTKTEKRSAKKKANTDPTSKSWVTSLTRDQAVTISSLILVSTEFREKFLLQPGETALNFLGLVLSEADCAEILRRADDIRDLGERMDQQMQTKLGVFNNLLPHILQENGGGKPRG